MSCTMIGNIVINIVPFRSEWLENLIPVSKPEQQPPLFHLGWNLGPFRSIQAEIKDSAGMNLWPFPLNLMSDPLPYHKK